MLPVGQTVTVAIVGAGGTVASGSGTIGKDGLLLGLRRHVVAAGRLVHDPIRLRGRHRLHRQQRHRDADGDLCRDPALRLDDSGARRRAAPIQIAVDDAIGNDLASPGLVVTAVQIVDANGRTFTPSAKRNSNPGNVFRDTGSSYTYNLDTSGLARGMYTLFITVGTDPVEHGLMFIVS